MTTLLLRVRENEELPALVQELAALADEDQVIAAWEHLLAREVTRKSAGAWANACNALGEVLQERALSQELQIAGLLVLLRVRQGVSPGNWATTQRNLGKVYLHRIRGDRAANLDSAIACYEAALRVYVYGKGLLF